MSERSPITPPTPEQLFRRLTALTYDYDPQFARGHTDAMDLERRSRKLIGRISVDNENDSTIPLYNERIVRLSAERNGPTKRYARRIQPAGFTVQQEIIKQVSEVPKSIRHRLDREIVECYDDTEPGDLNTVNFVHYSVLNDDGDIEINRNIGYKLRSVDEVIFESSELIGQPEPHSIPIPHRQKTLRQFTPIADEAVEDKIEQISYDAAFDQFTDGVVNMELFTAIRATRDADAAISILALVKCLHSHRIIPKKLIL